MLDVLLEEMVIYGIAGEPVIVEDIIIIPAFYEFFPERNCYEDTRYSYFDEYMSNNSRELTKICNRYAKFATEYNLHFLGVSCDAIWSHAKIMHTFNYYPPSLMDWRDNILDFSFVAITISNLRKIVSIHPFCCIEDNLHACLYFPCKISLEEIETISSSFWEILINNQGFANFHENIRGSSYDDYGFTMGCGLAVGHWNNQFFMDKIEPNNL